MSPPYDPVTLLLCTDPKLFTVIYQRGAAHRCLLSTVCKSSVMVSADAEGWSYENVSSWRRVCLLWFVVPRFYRCTRPRACTRQESGGAAADRREGAGDRPLTLGVHIQNPHPWPLSELTSSMVLPEMTFQSIPALMDGPPKPTPQDSPEKPCEGLTITRAPLRGGTREVPQWLSFTWGTKGLGWGCSLCNGKLCGNIQAQ